MARKLTAAETTEFSITLPTIIVQEIMDLIPSGKFGSSRGEVARNLILDQLKQSSVRAILAEERAAKSAS
jgi:Arc/MetJ-type ribon-helix-helix transcriptional regulator